MKIRKPRFILSLLIILLIISSGVYGYFYYFLNSLKAEGGAEGYPEPVKRVNVVVMGIAKNMADTIMLCSFDPKTSEVDIFSIPRDTYYLRKGYTKGAQKKINSAYGSGGADTVVKSVEGLTGVPVHFYVSVDYDAVKAIVDAMGGINVEIPIKMNYDDPGDDLHIHFEKGQVVKKGEDIVKVLRYRKNNRNKGGYPEGDLGRIKMQQHVVNLGMQKIMSGNIVLNFMRLQDPIQKHVKTNMSPKQMMHYITKASRVNKDNVVIQTIPGRSRTIERLSYFVPDNEKMSELMKKLKD